MAKRTLWLAACLFTSLSADLSIDQMEVMVEKIKAKRVGIKREKSETFVSPFVLIQRDENRSVIEDPQEKEAVFVLGGIMNDKAFLNDTWVKVGDKPEGYEVTAIDERSVTLVQGDRTITVFLKKSKPILQLNEGLK